MKKLILNMSLVALATGAASAAVVTWSPVIANSTEADIITAGTLHVSSNSAGTTTQTLNGVPFVPDTGPLTNGAEGTFFTAGGGDTGSAAFNALLDSHTFGSTTFNVTGLAIGTPYQIQIIGVGDTRGCCATRTEDYTSGGATSGTLTRSDPDSVVGSFLADATTQSFVVTTNGGLSGYQVRAVPEPSGVLLMGLSGVALLLRRRR